VKGDGREYTSPRKEDEKKNSGGVAASAVFRSSKHHWKRFRHDLESAKLAVTLA
jgi:hypothetical protein